MRALLFGEAQGRVVVSTSQVAELLAVARRHGVPAREIGRVDTSSESLRIRIGGRMIDAPLARLAEAYHEAIPRIMARSVATIAAAAEDTLMTPVA